MLHGEAGSHLSASRSFQTQYSGQPGRTTAQTQSSLSIAPPHYVEFQLFAGFLTRQKTTTLLESRHFIPVTFILPRLPLRRNRLKHRSSNAVFLAPAETESAPAYQSKNRIQTRQESCGQLSRSARICSKERRSREIAGAELKNTQGNYE